MTRKIRIVGVEEYAYCQQTSSKRCLETWIWRQIVSSQTAHTKYKWPPYATEWNAPMKIFYVRHCVNLVGTIFALWLKTRNNEWDVLVRVRPLLRKWRHRAKITTVRIAFEWELSIDWEFNPMIYANPFLQNALNLTWIIL